MRVAGNRRLIINADDFGWGKKLTDKIIECHVNGIVTSTTLMVNMQGAEYAASRTPDFPNLSVGLHLNLTEGIPIADVGAVPDLVDTTGNFPGNAAQSKRLWSGDSYYEQVRKEVEAQLRRFFDLGIEPTHCDSHHGIHKMPVVQRAMIDVFKRYGLTKLRTTLSYHRMRRDVFSIVGIIPWSKQNIKRFPAIMMHMRSHIQLKKAGFTMPDWKATTTMGVPSGTTPTEKFIACIAATPDGCSEILVHPGDHGEQDTPSDWHLKTWQDDTAMCLDPQVAEFIRESGIELISYRQL